MSKYINLPIADHFDKKCFQVPKKHALFANEQFYSYQELRNIVFSVYQKIKVNFTNNLSSYIGIYFEDNVQSYAALIAISLSGAAYVPLNPKLPVERNRTILEKANVRLILYSGELPVGIKKKNIKAIALDEQSSYEPSENEQMPSFINNDIAYLLFTSGTTGNPKGVPVSKQSVHALFNFFLENPDYNFGMDDRFLQVYELSFDVSVFSFFMPISCGACCYIAPQNGVRYLNILKMLKDHNITVVSMVSTLLYFVERYLKEIQLPDLRLCLLTADALNQHLAAKWSLSAPNARLENWYGPTEATIWCTRYLWNEKSSATETINGLVALGKPLPSFETTIIDEDFSSTPKGKKGELCVAGPQVVNAYLNNEKPESFFEATVNGHSRKFYRTGDLVSLNENNNLLFFGRADSQVKINAYRIELGEIEAALHECTQKMTAVVCHPNSKGIKELYAFVEDKFIDIEKVKKKLGDKLPNYMIPKYIFAVPKIPISLNGKIDRKTLKQSLKNT